MELRQIRYFVKVAETRSFSQAARLLHISQSTLSEQIMTLEGELGAPLFIRDSHHVDLSDEGKTLLPLAVQISKDVETSIQKIRDVRNLATGNLEIGATYSFFPLLLVAVRDFVREYPGIHLDIICGSVDTLMRLLHEGKLDVVLSYMTASPFSNIESHPLFKSELCVVCRQGHPLSDRSEIDFAELSMHRLALPARGLQARNSLNAVLDAGKYRFDVNLEVNDINMLLDIVAGSDLVTVLSRSSVNHMKALCAIPLRNPSVSMEGAYHIQKGAYFKKAMNAFITNLKDNNDINRTIEKIEKDK